MQRTRTRLTPPWLSLALGAGVALGASACTDSGGGSGGAVTAAASSQTAPGSVQAQTATALALRVPFVVSGAAPLDFSLVDAASGSVAVEVRFSTDGGVTWQPATLQTGASSLQAAPAPGVRHTLIWESDQDLPGLTPEVEVQVGVVGGGVATARAAVDNQGVPAAAARTVTRQPYLQSTTPTSSYVLWRTGASTDTVIEYGPTGALGQVAGDPQASTDEHQVELTGLAADAVTYYRVVAGGQPVTSLYAFKTAPRPDDTDFTFLVVGDSGMANPEQDQVAALMAAEREAELFLHTGDIVYPVGGLGAAVPEYNARFFKPYQDMLTRVPAFPVVGNHDLYGLFGQPYRDTFVMPPNGGGRLLEELYFSFEWGDAKFVAIETNILYQFTPIGPHIQWLRDELTQNTKKWLIVYMHTPLYSAGKHGDNQVLQSLLEPLFERTNVDLVLCGHDHNYERTRPIKQFNQDPSYPGLVHVITGGGGAALRPVNPTPRTDLALSAHHYTKVRVDGDWLRGEAIDIGGNVIDTWAVPDR